MSENEVKNLNNELSIDVQNVTVGEYDSDEHAQEFFVKTNDDLTEKFYLSNQDSIYILSDGCRFYFNRK